MRPAAATHGRPPAGGGRRLTRLSYADACRFLFSRQAGRIKWSLAPTTGLLDVLGHPERHYPCIHVGGTNGKGSTCAFLAADLESRGWRAGLYTSPHLVSACERVTVNGQPITEDAFAEWTALLQPHIERLEASFFEAVTAIALADFAARGVDIAVIEVGLGGRLDATNVVDPLAAVVTKIALEHTEYLGTDLAGIAREKAGIAKPGRPFLTGEQDPVIRRVLDTEARARGAAPVVLVDSARTPPSGVQLGLRGRHQWANAWVALATLEVLPAPFGRAPGGIPDSFAAAYVPGRLDVRGEWIFDVAHNPDGARVLARGLLDLVPRRPLHALVGVLGDKDYLGMIAELAPVADQFVFTVPASAPAERRWDLSRLQRELGGGTAGARARFEPDFDRALAAVQEGAASVLVTGSFHTVGDALARLPGFAPVG